MRYLPHTDADRAGMLARDRRRLDRRSVRRHPRRQAARRPARPADDQERDRGRAHPRPHRGAERRRRLGAVLRRRRRLPPPRAGERRPPDPALRVPHLLHAVPARGRAGHAAISLRVPDPGREPDRAWRSPTPPCMTARPRTAEAVLMAHRADQAAEGGPLRRPPSAIPRRSSRPSRTWPATRSWRCRPTRPGTEAILAAIDADTSCVVVQSPSFYGHLIDLAPIAEKAHAVGALLVAVFTEVVALGAIEPPGAQGADIVVGEGQSIGNPLTFGGPYVGLFATRQKFVRQMPGRLCGETVDAEGRRGFVLTLSTREQHIRRDKATSNICTNSGLCCLAFTIHMTLLGETGLRRLAALNHANAVKLAESLVGGSGRKCPERLVLQRVHHPRSGRRRRRDRDTRAEGHPRRRAGVAARTRTSRSSPISSSSPRPRSTPTRTAPPTPRR